MNKNKQPGPGSWKAESGRRAGKQRGMGAGVPRRPLQATVPHVLHREQTQEGAGVAIMAVQGRDRARLPQALPVPLLAPCRAPGFPGPALLRLGRGRCLRNIEVAGRASCPVLCTTWQGPPGSTRAGSGWKGLLPLGHAWPPSVFPVLPVSPEWGFWPPKARGFSPSRQP